MFEYAALTAAISLFTTALGGLSDAIAGKLARSDAVAVNQAVLRARSVGISSAGARTAYAHAPYRTPALRYVYVSGWIAGEKHALACEFARLAPDELQADVAKEVRKSRVVIERLRRLRITVAQAAAAFARGFLSACGG